MDIKTLRSKVGKLADALSLPEKYILPIFTIQWGCGTVKKPNLLNLNGSTGHGKHDASLYYNGILFIRVMLPFFIGLHVRWSGDPAVKKQYMQTHIGWRKNGDFVITFRIQCDASSAIGTYGQNVNQAQGWSCGCH
ncbi:MAG: hypothetical protein ACYC9K_00890 [Sulfuricaulis sp.]